jgi:hypothetical protein
MSALPLTHNLTIGNIVSVAFKLYKKNFSQFVRLTATGGRFLFFRNRAIPYLNCVGLLALHELRAQPTSLEAILQGLGDRAALLTKASRHAMRPILLAYVIFMGAIFFVAQILIGLLWLPGLLLFPLSLVGYTFFVTWITTRTRTFLPFVVACEPEYETPAQVVQRCWKLTKGCFWRMMAINFLAGIITSPLSLLPLLGYLLLIRVSVGNPELFIFGLLLFFVLIGVSFVITSPFWQSLRAVMYYDLRTRREGADLQLRSRES